MVKGWAATKVELHRITESNAWTEDVQHLQHLQPTHNVPSPRPSPSPSPSPVPAQSFQYRPSLEPYNVLTPLANPEATFACQFWQNPC